MSVPPEVDSLPVGVHSGVCEPDPKAALHWLLGEHMMKMPTGTKFLSVMLRVHRCVWLEGWRWGRALEVQQVQLRPASL